jgi:hypothetical protein
MADHRIDLEPSKRGFGGDSMFLDGVLIGKSEESLYAAARWLLANGAAEPDDTVATYRGGTLCMSGRVGHLAKLTTIETKSGKPSLYLRRYEAYSGPRVEPQTGETGEQATQVAEATEFAIVGGNGHITKENPGHGR